MAYPILLSVGMYYAKLGTVRPAVGAVVGEGRQKSIVRSCQLLPQQAWSFNNDTQVIDTFKPFSEFVL